MNPQDETSSRPSNSRAIVSEDDNSANASMASSSSAAQAQKATKNVNKTYLYSFIDAFTTDEFKERFDVKNFNVDQFCQWISTIGGQETTPQSIRTIYALSQDKVQRHNMKTDTSGKEASTSGNTDKGGKEPKKITTVVEALASQQVRQIFRASLAVMAYGANDPRVLELFNIMFREGDVSPKYLVGTMYLPAALGSARAGRKQFPLNKPSRIEALLYFHCIRQHVSKKMKYTANMGNRVGLALQTIVSAWKRLVDNIGVEKVGTLSNLIIPYVVFNRQTGMFRTLSSRNDGFSPTTMERTIENCVPSAELQNVSAAAWHRVDALDTAIRYIVNMFFNHMHDLLGQPYLYSANDADLVKWNELQPYKLPQDVKCIPTVFAKMPDSVADGLGITKPDVPSQQSSQAMDHVVVDSDEDVIMKEPQGSKRGPNTPEDQGAQKHQKTGTNSTVVKEEPINVSIRPGRDPGMSQQTEQAYNAVCDEMLKKFGMNEERFQDLVDLTRDTFGVDLAGSVDLVLTDPPYNVRKDGGREHANHDCFSEQDMKDLGDFCLEVLKPGGHGIIFCSFTQFQKYREILTSYSENVLDYESDPTGNTYSKTSVFTVEATPLVFVRADGNFNNPSRNNLTHVNMVEICVHFWRKGGDDRRMRQRIDYKTPTEYGGTMPSWTNVVTDVPIPTGSEVVYIPSVDENEAPKYKLRPEQKPTSLLKFLINKFTTGGDLVVDTCAGTFSTMKACMEMDKHRRFIGTDSDPRCASTVEDALTGLFAKQVQNPQSDITVSTVDLRQHTQTVCAYVSEHEVRKRASAWTVAPGLVPMQNFPPHILQALCQYHNDFALYPNRHLSMNRWGLQLVQQMNNMDVKFLRAYEANVIGLVIKKSTIQHPYSGLGVFTTKAVAKGEVLGYYYGALVYGNIGVKSRLHKRYGTGILSVSSEDFEKWSAKINPYQFIDSNNNKYDGYIAPAPFCVCRYINDPRYRKGDKNAKSQGARRKANVEFRVDPKARCNRDFEKYTAVAVVATDYIPADHELFVEYGSEYVFKDKK